MLLHSYVKHHCMLVLATNMFDKYRACVVHIISNIEIVIAQHAEEIRMQLRGTQLSQLENCVQLLIRYFC